MDSFNALPPWSAFRSSDYGYSRIKVHNATHLNLQQVSDDLVVNLFTPIPYLVLFPYIALTINEQLPLNRMEKL